MRKKAANSARERTTTKATPKPGSKRRSAKHTTSASTPKPILGITKIESPVDQAVANVTRATTSGKWMVAAWRIDGNTIFLDRIAFNFPKADVDTAMQLIVQDVQKLKVE